ncbi:MAG: hypothetical protein N3C63_01565 [Rhodocyclaceae bacterium]|nr:hypothetical protein [Rhodocyclaceae bacterium]
MSGTLLAPRLLLCHKQRTSARTRFVRWPHGMLAFTPPPAGAALLAATPTVRPHPAALLEEAARRLGLPKGSLCAETEFSATLATPEGDIPVVLAYFATLDPPFDAVESQGGRFIAITDARDVGALELALLRRAYEILIG